MIDTDEEKTVPETAQEAVITVSIRDDGDERWDVKFDLKSGSQRLLVALAAIVSGSDTLAAALDARLEEPLKARIAGLLPSAEWVEERLAQHPYGGEQNYLELARDIRQILDGVAPKRDAEDAEHDAEDGGGQ